MHNYLFFHSVMQGKPPYGGQAATAKRNAQRRQSGAGPCGCPAKGHLRSARSKSVPLRGPVLKENRIIRQVLSIK